MGSFILRDAIEPRVVCAHASPMLSREHLLLLLLFSDPERIMTDEKALQIALLIKQFGRCMTADDELEHRRRARTFNASFDELLVTHGGESAATMAAHIARAIAPPEPPEDAPSPHLYARVLSDLLQVRSLDTPQDERRLDRQVS